MQLCSMKQREISKNHNFVILISQNAKLDFYDIFSKRAIFLNVVFWTQLKYKK